MTDQEYTELESLLGKLESVLTHKFCIIPNYIHGGYHIGIYSGNCGYPRGSATGPTIKETVELIKQQSNEQPK